MKFIQYIKPLSVAVLLAATLAPAYASRALTIYTVSHPDNLGVQVRLEGSAIGRATIIQRNSAGEAINTFQTDGVGYASIPVDTDGDQLLTLDVRHGEHRKTVVRQWVDRQSQAL